MCVHMCVYMYVHTYTYIHAYLCFWSLPICTQVKNKRTKKRNTLCAPYRTVDGIKCLLSYTSLLIFTKTSWSQICCRSLLYSWYLEQCLAYSACLIDIYLIMNEWSHPLILPNPFLAIFFYSHPTDVYTSKYILYFAVSICYFPCNLFC